MMDRNKKLVRNTLIYAIGNFSTRLISFFLLPLYTAYLTPNDYGEIDLIFICTQVVIPIFTLQITFAAVRHLFDTDDLSKQKHIISNAFFVLLVGMVLFVISFGIFVAITGYKYGIYIVFLIISNCFLSLLQESTRGLKKNPTYALVGVILSIIQIICNILFIVGLGLRSTALLISPTIAYTFSMLFIIVFTDYFKYLSIEEVSSNTIKKMLKYSIPLVPDALCWWLLLGFGRVFLSYLYGIAAVGIYAVANKFPSFLTMFYSIFNLAWQENAYSEYSKADRDSYYSNMYNALVKLILCVVIVVLPATKIIVPLMVGEAYKTAYLYVPILYVSAVMQILSSFYASGFESAKKTNGILVSTLVAVVLNITCNLLLTPRLGIFGISISMAISYLGLFVMRVIRSKQFFAIRVEKKSTVTLTFISIISLSIYYIDNHILQIVALFIGFFIFLYVNKIMMKLIFEKFRKVSEINVH